MVRITKRSPPPAPCQSVTSRFPATTFPGPSSASSLAPRISVSPSRNKPDSVVPPPVERVSTGVAGLDEILGGGLPMNHLYLLDGEPGTGKTTLALQFLLAGAGMGMRGLYVTL